jgi:hypothetical protein
MTDSSAQLETLQQANREAHQKLSRLTRELIAVAGAISFARSHFSGDDEWTSSDEFIVQICSPLETMLHDTAVLVANAKPVRDAASDAMSDYYRTRNAIKSSDESDNIALEVKSDRN